MALSDEEIRATIAEFIRGDVADYQLSALAMAIYFRGMTTAETTALTLAMRDSGRVLDFNVGRQSRNTVAKVDKHSTGGVGDKVSICLAPIVAACGVAVPMISGRGLGHTGGTLDKLEAIPGFRVELDSKAFMAQVRDIGCALIGQTKDLAPADKRFYALRDVTGTVESIPLITASILSKKLAEGIDALVLDVKVGRGAFMKTQEDARALARSIVGVGRRAGKKVTAVLTRMDEPLGHAIGNALETREAFEVLGGSGPEDVVECTMVLGAEMLCMANVATNARDARRRMQDAIASGAAVAMMERIIAAQSGDPRVVTEWDRLPRANVIVPVVADRSGHVAAIDALELGLASVTLGAGRVRVDQAIDPAVGLVLQRKIGDPVAKGATLAELHVRKRADAARVSQRVANAFAIAKQKPVVPPLVLETIRR